MKVKSFFILCLIIIGVFSFVPNLFTYWIEGLQLVLAQDDNDDDEEKEEKIEDLEEEIEELEEKIEDLQKQEISLSRELERANSQIALTELKIQSSINDIARKEKEIKELEEDIEDLRKRIETIKNSIAYQQKVLGERKRSFYKVDKGNAEEFDLLLFVLEPFELENKIKKKTYSEIMQDRDKKLIDEMTETRNAYDKQKGLFEEKKAKEEELREQLVIEQQNLENYKISLENTKLEKQRLIEITKNDEAEFQKKLANARRELNQITSAVAILKNQQSTDVDKGTIIGYQGSTGYSFGEHLHFGVYKYSSFEDIEGWNWYYSNYVDPKKKLSSKSVYWNTGCESAKTREIGDGDWRWPIDSPTISQGFGHTCWSNIYYGGKVHPAYDMFSSYGAPVYAVDDGRAYYCRNCLGDGGNGVFIFHDDDYMTVYWHLR